MDNCIKNLRKLLEAITNNKNAILDLFYEQGENAEERYLNSFKEIESRIELSNHYCDINLINLNHCSKVESIKDLMDIEEINTLNVSGWVSELYSDIELEIKSILTGKFGFWKIIHPMIENISKEKFEDGHYADAVESAFKEINNRVKTIYQNKMGEEKDGTDLMNNAFKYNPNNQNPPCIAIDNDLTLQNGINRQKGYQFIFSGVILAIRNVKAHNNIIITKDDGIHSIFLASMLMYVLDNAIY